MIFEENIFGKIVTAAKWSIVTEILSKIIPPVTNMILARIFTPDVFGIMATITMVITFADVFVESGFQKFLIQHNFSNIKEEYEYMSVAFWANLIFSFIIWGVLVIFNQTIARLVGNEGLGYLIVITGMTIPLYGIIGIQGCKIKKELKFKKLFYVRFITSILPLFITVPLALLEFGYWALIIGCIIGSFIQSLLLFYVGKFLPIMFFSKQYLFHMLQFGIWTILDGIAIWLTAWIDSFLIANYMSDYYLGLYKNTSSMIFSFFSIVTAAMIPVLFSALSRFQNDQEMFNKTFLNTQNVLALALLPLGTILYFYRAFVTNILFGSAWMEAADIVGVMAITTVVRILFVSIYSEVYRAKGKFYLPLIMQLVDLCVLVPICVISVKYGFWALVYARSFVRLDLIVPMLVVTNILCGITPLNTIKNVLNPFIATVFMIICILIMQSVYESFLWYIISIFISASMYLLVLFFFKKERCMMLSMFGKFKYA